MLINLFMRKIVYNFTLTIWIISHICRIAQYTVNCRAVPWHTAHRRLTILLLQNIADALWAVPLITQLIYPPYRLCLFLIDFISKCCPVWLVCTWVYILIFIMVYLIIPQYITITIWLTISPWNFLSCQRPLGYFLWLTLRQWCHYRQFHKTIRWIIKTPDDIRQKQYPDTKLTQFPCIPECLLNISGKPWYFPCYNNIKRIWMFSRLFNQAQKTSTFFYLSTSDTPVHIHICFRIKHPVICDLRLVPLNLILQCIYLWLMLRRNASIHLNT